MISITVLGYAASAWIPFRLGEFVRPFLISNYSGLAVGRLISIIFIERLLEIVALVIVYIGLVGAGLMPVWLTGLWHTYTDLAIFVCVLILLSILGIAGILVCWRHCAAFFSRAGLNKLAILIDGAVGNIKLGFSDVLRFHSVLIACLISVIIWLISGFSIFMLFPLLSLNLSIGDAFAAQLTTVFSIALPTAPGLLGNFHFGTIFALLMAGVDKTSALVFSLAFYCSGIGVNTIWAIFLIQQVRLPSIVTEQILPHMRQSMLKSDFSIGKDRR